MARIVFCEDDPTIRKLIQLTLRRTVHDISIAPDGLAGLALIERALPDLVVTDVSMPGLDGLQLADALVARPHLAAIPLVVISAAAQRAQIEEAHRHRVAAYLTKPFSPAALRALIDRLVGDVSSAGERRPGDGGDPR